MIVLLFLLTTIGTLWCLYLYEAPIDRRRLRYLEERVASLEDQVDDLYDLYDDDDPDDPDEAPVRSETDNVVALSDRRAA